MEGPNLGPEGCWYAGMVMALIGFVACIIGLVVGIRWLINHVYIY